MNRLACFFMLIATVSYAQDGHYTIGARAGALSGSTVTTADQWAIFSNVGAMGAVEASAAMVSYQNRYNIPGFQVMGGGFVYHQSPLLSTGIKYFKFGDHLYSQQKAGLALANRFQMVSLGIGLNVVQTAAEGLETRRTWILEMGGRAEITPQLVFAAHIFNVKHREHYPTVMKAGLSLRPVPMLMINLELEKQPGLDERFKTGLEYEIVPNLYLRTGLSLQANDLGQSKVKSTYGMGFLLRSFQVDYAFADNTSLGTVHELSLAYLLKRREK